MADDIAQRRPFLNPVQQSGDAVELLRASRDDDFIPVLDFANEKRSRGWSKSMARFMRYNMVDQIKKYRMMAKADCAIGGARAKLYGQVQSGVLVSDFFAKGGKIQSGRTNNNEESNK